MHTPLSPAPLTAFSAAAFLRRGLATMAFCALVAAGLTLSAGKAWSIHLVYSLATGLTTWLTIDLGRFVLRRRPESAWPAGLRGIALVALGIVLGFLVGSAVGDWYCGCSTWEKVAVAPNQMLTSLFITAASGVAGAYFFHSRGQQKAQQARIALAERDAVEARLKLLQAQLEPHMLFNTLANLRVLVGTDAAQATRMLDHLVAYLRSTLVASRETEHTLAQEFARLRDYLELMAVRMGPRLRYTLDLPAELADWPVPTLLLQPLVENCIQHGLEPHIAGGAIWISARRVGPGMALEVRDSGAGLSDVREVGAPAAGSGFGLVQVRERLGTAYGALATLQLEAASPTGTVARITLPALGPPP